MVYWAIHLENGKSVFYNGERITMSLQAVIDNINQLLWNVQGRWLCQNTALLRNVKRLYLELIVKEVVTTGTRKPIPGCPQVFSICIRRDECFYLRLLLVNVRSLISFQHMWTVNGVLTHCAAHIGKPVNVWDCLDTLHSLPIFVTLLNQRLNSSRWFFQTLLKITKVMFSWANVLYWLQKTSMSTKWIFRLKIR